MSQFYTSFAGLANGVGVPTGWTLRSTANTYEWRIDDGSLHGEYGSADLEGGKVLRGYGSQGTELPHVLTLDAAGGSVSQCDIIVRVTSSAWTNVGVGAVARAATSGANHDWSALTLLDTSLRTRYAGTADSVLHGGTWTAWTFQYVRLLLDGTNVKSTAATNLADVTGSTPTAGWLTNVTDPSPATSGHVGIGLADPNAFWFVDWVGIGTGGDAAPTETVTSDALATPTNFTFASAAGLRQLDGAWTTVSGAATYSWEVEEDVAGVWTAFDSGSTADTSFQLTSTDGVEWGTTYRGRVRAVPA